MNGLDAIKKKLTGEIVSPEEAFVHNICVVMREFNLSYEEMMNLPFPTFIIMLRILEKESKKASAKDKKGMQRYVK